jgi:hypothetical protein
MLWLPSDIPSHVRPQVCSMSVIDAELKLLLADLHDALVNVRRYRRLYCSLRSFYQGSFNGSSSGPTTRKRGELEAAGKKIEINKIRYQTSWKAAHALDPEGEWRSKYLELKTKDIRGPQPGDDDETDLAAQDARLPQVRDFGGGQYETSWIWKTITDSDEPGDYVRVHWAKLAAHTNRWTEELTMVKLEMSRTLLSFMQRANWWKQQRLRRHDGISHQLSYALEAYAARQESMLRRRSDRFILEWYPTLRQHHIDDVIPAAFLYSTTARQAAVVSAAKTRKRPVTNFLAQMDALVDSGVVDSSCLMAEDCDGMLVDGPPPMSAIPDLSEGQEGEGDMNHVQGQTRVDDDESVSDESSMSEYESA